MKLINRDTDYAVRAMLRIAGSPDRTPVTVLVDELDIPRPFLRKILQTLTREGILRSFRGKTGGFELARPADRIFLTEVIRIFQGPLNLNECVFGRELCPDIATCPLRAKIEEIEKHVHRELGSVTIKSLMEDRAIIEGSAVA